MCSTQGNGNNNIGNQAKKDFGGIGTSTNTNTNTCSSGKCKCKDK